MKIEQIYHQIKAVHRIKKNNHSNITSRIEADEDSMVKRKATRKTRDKSCFLADYQ